MKHLSNLKEIYLSESNLVISKNPFLEITIDVIEDILSEPGNCEGFNSAEDALEEMSFKLSIYHNLENPLTLYRVLSVESKDDIDLEEVGEHYIMNIDYIDTSFFDSIGASGWDHDHDVYLLTVSVDLSEIDAYSTVFTNLSFPNEEEITLKNKGKNVKIVNIKKIMKR